MNEKGYTLIEIIAVLLILAIIVSISLFKFVDLGVSADENSLVRSVSELNTREKMIWAQIRLINYIDDIDLFSKVEYDISGCEWISGPNISGGRLKCGKAEKNLTRSASTRGQPGTWR